MRAVVDDMAAVQTSMSYDPYGNPMGAYGEGFGFTGEQTDVNGSVFLRARYYELSKGSFIKRDPLETPNRYAYVSGNPVNLTDPSGLCAGPVLCDAWIRYGLWNLVNAYCRDDHEHSYCDGNVWDDNHESCTCPSGYEKVQDGMGAGLQGYFCYNPRTRRYYNPYCPSGYPETLSNPARHRASSITGTSAGRGCTSISGESFDWRGATACDDVDGMRRGRFVARGTSWSTFGITGQGAIGGTENVFDFATMEFATFTYNGVLLGGTNLGIGATRAIYTAEGFGFRTNGRIIEEYLGAFNSSEIGVGYARNIQPLSQAGINAVFGIGIGVGDVSGLPDSYGGRLTARYSSFSFGPAISLPISIFIPSINVAATDYEYVDGSYSRYTNIETCTVDREGVRSALLSMVAAAEYSETDVELWEARCRQGCLGREGATLR